MVLVSTRQVLRLLGGPDLELLGFFFAELPTGLIFWICGAACFSPVVLAVGLFFYVGR
jgi:hypothetical protein